jgi:7,8-dihydro-6-hydroxymethylpterin-pyrophosphokinase
VRYDDVTLDEPGLTLPHPGLPVRDFWQRELAELLAHVD